MNRRNMGRTDRVVRFVVGVTLLPIGLIALSGVSAIAAVALAVVALGTSFAGFCPGYVPFGISTLRGERRPTKTG
jgi:hypothetical protein